MAWKYVRASDVEGQRQRQATLDRMTVWWTAFVHKLPEFGAEREAQPDGAGVFPRVVAVSESLRTWMDEQIGLVDPRLRWELTEDDAGEHLLAITCGEHLHLRPVVQSLVLRAPPIPRWKFQSPKPALPAAAAMDVVRARTGHRLLAPTAMARLSSDNRVDLLFKLMLARTDPAAAQDLAVDLAETVLGEDIFYRWLGEIEAEALDRGPAPDQFLNMSQLRSTVAGLSQSIVHQLPPMPYHKQLAQKHWPTLKFSPPAAPDYSRQDDLAIGRTWIPAAREAAFGKGPGRAPTRAFYSANFSRFGETFCYLKIDLPDVSMEKRRQRKYKVEDKIDPALRKAEIGCVVGSSTGTRYVYLDLAVTDLNKTLAVLSGLLPSLDMPDRSWLLFYDSELADEYIGLRPGSGPPPQAPGLSFGFRKGVSSKTEETGSAIQAPDPFADDLRL